MVSICDINLFTSGLFLLFSWRSVYGYSYLFQGATGFGSHFLAAAYLAEAMVYRGHNVTFVISHTAAHHMDHPKWGRLFDFELYKSPSNSSEYWLMQNALIEKSLLEGILTGTSTYFPKVMSSLAAECEAVFLDEELIANLRKENFDFLVYDTFWPCSAILAEELSIKSILMSPSGYIGDLVSLLGSPANPAFISYFVESPPLLPFTFFERVVNYFLAKMTRVMFQYSIMPMYDNIRRRLNMRLDMTYGEFLLHQTELVLLNMDAELEAPVPLSPNIIPVGGLTAHKAEPLPTDLEQFAISDAEDGLVVFSLGTFVNRLPKRIIRVIIDAFVDLPYKVVWKFDNIENEPLPPNVKAQKWLPLNDLLGHNQTKVFVCQGGNNGFYEAIYHGVPMVVLPVMADQDLIGSKVQVLGIGTKLNIRTMTSFELKQAITKVMTDPRIRENSRRLRNIYLDKPMNATERAAHWIEHVTRFGGSSYKPELSHLNYFQSSLLDVYFFLALFTVTFTFFLYKTFLFVVYFCLRCLGVVS